MIERWMAGGDGYTPTVGELEGYRRARDAERRNEQDEQRALTLALSMRGSRRG